MRTTTLKSLFILGLLLPLLTLAAEARFTEDSTAVVNVLKLMDERLSLMPDVAAWKYRNRSPIADPKREKAVIERALLVSEPIGLAPDAVRQLFELQVRLARDTQAHLHAQWSKQSFDASRKLRDLDSDLRPRLDQLTFDLLRALYVAAPALQQPDFVSRYTSLADQALRAEGWTDETRREVLTTLGRVTLKPAPVLERVRSAGVLRIGTTGDYAPFSLQSGDRLAGSDIELAQALARHIDAQPVFVRTTWSTLIEDLRQNKFDLAIGGVSITPAREAVGEFSVPYTSGGKTIISRCADAPAYNSLPAIDKREVRLIVNPGGTNEQYVREHVRNAQIRVFPDNRLIFDEIRAGRADVMVTDDVEVELQTRRHSDLCRALPGTLTHADKAVFLPRDERWTAEVNEWLSNELSAGRPARLIEQFLQ